MIVGAGGMGRAWGRNLRDCEETDVVGWVDIRPEAAAELICHDVRPIGSKRP